MRPYDPSLDDADPGWRDRFLIPPYAAPLDYPDAPGSAYPDVAYLAGNSLGLKPRATRDALMVELAASHPEYGWDVNKGYASPEHLDALRRLGPCVQHRRSWAIPGGDRDPLRVEDQDDALALG